MRKLIISALAAIIAGTIAALAGNVTLLSPPLGDVVFPFQVGPKCTATGTTPQTCNAGFGSVTTGTLTTAASTTATFTINNSFVTAGQSILCSAAYSGAGDPVIESCTAGAGTIVVQFRNVNGATALNAAMTINFQLN